MTAMPTVRPSVPHFSSGPCAKRPGWNLSALKDAFLGRSHRAKGGKVKLKRAIEETRAVLEVPADFLIGIVPASDTGAVEMAMWSMLGARPVTMLAWESFGEGWITDVAKQLKLKDASVVKAPYGELPDLWDFVPGTWEDDSVTSRFGEEGEQEPYLRGLKQLTSKPVVGVGRFTSPDLMARMVQSGILDFIGAARPSIADPFLPRKIE